MNVWAISDLHLSFARPERRERYAARWRDHAARIEQDWREAVRPGDLVLLPGDLSMARNHRDLQPDLEWLERLPGTRSSRPGNHDRWWNGVEPIRPMLRRSLLAVDGDAVATHGVVVCGTLGVPAPPDEPSPSRRPRRRARARAPSTRPWTGRRDAWTIASAALRPLALPPLRPPPPARARASSGSNGRRHGLRLRPPAHPGQWALAVQGIDPGRPLPLRRRRRHRLPAPQDRQPTRTIAFAHGAVPALHSCRPARTCALRSVALGRQVASSPWQVPVPLVPIAGFRARLDRLASRV